MSCSLSLSGGDLGGGWGKAVGGWGKAVGGWQEEGCEEQRQRMEGGEEQRV